MPTRLRTGLDRARDLRDDAERHGRASACRRYRSASFSRDGHERRQQLAGVVVNRHPNLARDECDVLKAILTNCIRHGPASQNRAAHPDFRAYLAGRVAHARALNAARGAKLHALFARIAWDGCGFGA
jgi:Zn-dependent M28 family amino/carboxypeptidase